MTPPELPIDVQDVIFLGALLAGCGYAALRGGAPERWGALALFGGVVLSNLAMRSSGTQFATPEISMMWVDMLVGGVFLVLAAFSQRYWPIWAAAVQIDAIATHLLMFSSATPPFSYAFALWLWSLPLPILIGIGAWRHRQRVKHYGADPAWSRMERKSHENRNLGAGVP